MNFNMYNFLHYTVGWWLSPNLFKFLSVLMEKHMQSLWGLLPSLPELRPCQNEMKNKSPKEGNKLAMNQKSQEWCLAN